MHYRREVDGLRAVAVLPVILWHAGVPAVSGGYTGVDIFFVISGYLIAGILYEESVAGRFSILAFYERRARRILPALFLVLVATLPFAWAWMQPEALLGYARSMLATLFFCSNLYFWQTSNYFAIADGQLPLLHTWSLAVEEQFYLLFPLLLALLWRWSPRHILPVLGTIAVASLALSEWSWRDWPEANFYLAHTRAWELLAGAFISVAALRGWTGQGVHRAMREGLALTGLGLMFASFFLYDDRTPFPSVYALMPVVGAGLALVFAGQGTVAARLLSLPPVVGLGLISYSAYLWHQPIFAFARIRLIDPSSPGLMTGLILLALALAAFSWRFVERPFRQRRGAAVIPARRVWQFAGGGGVMLCLAALALLQTGGAPYRFSPEVRALGATFDQVFNERIRLARVGLCELNTKIVQTSEAEFERTWACKPMAGDALRPTRLAIFGDSHSSDIAMALRLNGLDMVHVAGAGCAVAPDRMLGKCRRLAEFMKRQIVADGVTELWLVERLEGRELTAPSVAAIADYWAAPGLHISVFSPMPEFPDLKDRLIKEAWLGQSEPLPRNREAEEAFATDRVADRLRVAGIDVIDSAAIYCRVMPKCEPLDGTTLLSTDGNHLTAEGARRFGAALLAAVPPPMGP